MRLRFQLIELSAHLAAEIVGSLFRNVWWERERQRRFLRPLRIGGVEVDLWTFGVEYATAEFVYKHLCAWPIARVLHQACGYGVGQDVRDLLDHDLLRHEPYHAGLLVIPYWSFPRAVHLGAERNEAMEKLQEARQRAMYVGDNKMQVRGHHAERMNAKTIAAGGYDEGVDYQLGDCSIGAKEQMSAQRTTSYEICCTGDDDAGLAHDLEACRKRHARGEG